MKRASLRLCPSLQGCASSFRRQNSTAPRRVNTSSLPPPRPDYKSISDNVISKSLNAVNRKAALASGAVETTARLYNQIKPLTAKLDQKLGLRNRTADHVKSNTGLGSDASLLIEQAKVLKHEITELKARLANVQSELLHAALRIPNDTHPDTPIGPESVAVTLSTHGPDPLPATPERDHVRCGYALQMLDLDAGATVTGSSWYFLTNEGALLELALINYALSVAIKHGYKPVLTPDVVRADIAMRCGFQPRDQAEVQQMYYLASESGKENSGLVLSGTAEIPLGGLFANKVYDELELPVKVVGVGKAFRAEAGARGTDTRGLYRVHQFSKVELFAVTSEIQSEDTMEDMRKVQIEILDGLRLPFRVLDMPTEELGASAYRKYDIEAWMPGRGRWGEVTSTSNCTDYQSRRLIIRYRRKASSSTPLSSIELPKAPSIPHEKQPLLFAHTLNGTAAAIPRLIVAILENGVHLEGQKVRGLELPSALRPFWVGDALDGTCKIIWR